MAAKQNRSDEQPEILGLSELLEAPLIRLDVRAGDRWEAIEALVDVLIAKRRIPRGDRSIILAALFDREGRRPSTLKNGAAVPACAYDRALTASGIAMPRAVLAVGRCPQGVDFRASDDVPVTLIFLLLLPRARFSRCAEGLPQLANLFETGELTRRLMAVETAEAFIEAVEEAESWEQAMDAVNAIDPLAETGPFGVAGLAGPVDLAGLSSPVSRPAPRHE